jgi:hypothetical protein
MVDQFIAIEKERLGSFTACFINGTAVCTEHLFMAIYYLMPRQGNSNFFASRYFRHFIFRVMALISILQTEQTLNESWGGGGRAV